MREDADRLRVHGLPRVVAEHGGEVRREMRKEETGKGRRGRKHRAANNHVRGMRAQQLAKGLP